MSSLKRGPAAVLVARRCGGLDLRPAGASGLTSLSKPVTATGTWTTLGCRLDDPWLSHAWTSYRDVGGPWDVACLDIYWGTNVRRWPSLLSWALSPVANGVGGYIYIYMFTYYIYLCIHTIYIYIYICIRIIYIYIHICLYTYCIYIYIHTSIFMCIYIYMYTYVMENPMNIDDLGVPRFKEPPYG